ncbi:MAG: SprT family zinc-dependent metalloprotease [Patescibacteria group bacterium]|nr:SprT family zinc-dependent metalloprotease [Patescibacteria group bacterium]
MEKINADKIIRTRRRTIALIITPDARLIIRAPFLVSNKCIDKFIYEKRFWIKKKTDEAIRKLKKITQKKFINNENFLYIGKEYKLKIVKNSDCALKFNNGFVLSERNTYKAKQIFINWYKQMAYIKISERVKLYAEKNKIRFRKISITNAQKRWGSCSFIGNLNFSWRLIMSPLDVIDYVVVHELSHIEHKNHSKKFWNKVETMMPNYKECKVWLNENNNLLFF